MTNDECDPIIDGGDQGLVVSEEFGSEMRLDERGIVHVDDDRDCRLDKFGANHGSITGP